MGASLPIMFPTGYTGWKGVHYFCCVTFTASTAPRSITGPDTAGAWASTRGNPTAIQDSSVDVVATFRMRRETGGDLDEVRPCGDEVRGLKSPANAGKVPYAGSIPAASIST